ncbi:MAG: biopolymer transporter ExbD [Phycisphaerales bacterium]|jgi:biopolymer transport protein ExbD|nr:biopolymer transporter ExbD [Phycisphaerales bacterium]
MRFASRNKQDRLLPVDMTPMIDIVFQLLIFFLTTAQLAQFSRAEMDLPQEAGEQTEAAEEAGIIVNLLADGTIQIAGERLDDAAFAVMAEELVLDHPGEELARLRPLVRADRNAAAARLNRVLEILQSAGVPAVRIATAPGA